VGVYGCSYSRGAHYASKTELELMAFPLGQDTGDTPITLSWRVGSDPEIPTAGQRCR
jgi:hypothetical protein